jgi:hypothetical protein
MNPSQMQLIPNDNSLEFSNPQYYEVYLIVEAAGTQGQQNIMN